jgi:tetratricopeptide (TPR) repeat protein
VVGITILLAALSKNRSLAAQATHLEALRAGDSAWQAGRFDLARVAYREAVDVDSIGSSRAVYRLAVLYSWDGDLVRALPLFTRYTRLEPRDEEGRLGLARAYAWAGQTAPALALYDSVLGRDRGYRDAALGAAQTLAWAGRYDESLARYQHWLQQHQGDSEAALARARTLAWAGRLAAAEREYQRLAVGGAGPAAVRGAALAAAWRGDLFRSESMWREVIARDPDDVDAWVGLAQVLRWSGRSAEAKDALDRALALKPDHSEARAERRWVRADLAAAVSPRASASWDSDGNRSELLTAQGSVRPARQVGLTVSASRRWVALDLARGTSAAGRAAVRLTPGRRVSLTAELGLVRTSGEPAAGVGVLSRTTAVGGGGASLRIGSRATLAVAAAKDVFDETAPLILAGIEMATVSVDGDLTVAPGLVASVGGHRAELTGGSVDNVRQGAHGALRWRRGRAVSLALSGRAFGYDRSPRDGYFPPSRYRHGEVGLRWGPGRELGWAGFVEGALGVQQVRFDDPGDSRPTQRIGGGLAYRPGPGHEVAIDYAFSNVAGAGSLGGVSGSLYHAHVLSLRGRIRF